ncbi:MAG: hypothetical protein KY475_18575 [Planctomycetes bacterium]|nr:hypothetical protein [Planctomycetota bacterium]
MTDAVRDLAQLVETIHVAPQERASRARAIYESALHESPYLDGPNFNAVHPDDVRTIFDKSDELFFEGGIRRALGLVPLEFRLSPRMTSAGGKMTLYSPPGALGRRFQLTVSTALLFQTFREDQRQITVTGLPCSDRLQAMQRIIEHEMVHLIEILIWHDSRCAGGRFQSMARRCFGHTDHRHQLITPREAAHKLGVRVGSRVRFLYEGRTYEGRVNRVTKRATVLVEDARGVEFSDGKQYLKYYVPLAMLEPVDGDRV